MKQKKLFRLKGVRPEGEFIVFPQSVLIQKELEILCFIENYGDLKHFLRKIVIFSLVLEVLFPLRLHQVVALDPRKVL